MPREVEQGNSSQEIVFLSGIPGLIGGRVNADRFCPIDIPKLGNLHSGIVFECSVVQMEHDLARSRIASVSGLSFPSTPRALNTCGALSQGRGIEAEKTCPAVLTI